MRRHVLLSSKQFEDNSLIGDRILRSLDTTTYNGMVQIVRFDSPD